MLQMMNVRGLSIAHVKSHLQVKAEKETPTSHVFLVASFSFPSHDKGWT